MAHSEGMTDLIRNLALSATSGIPWRLSFNFPEGYLIQVEKEKVTISATLEGYCNNLLK